MFHLPVPFPSDMVSVDCAVVPKVNSYCWDGLSADIGDSLTDWFFFMVLDIGNPAIESIPLGTRFMAGILQAVAVRAAGFGIVALSALAPAVK
jgi:hypothetical protein